MSHAQPDQLALNPGVETAGNRNPKNIQDRDVLPDVNDESGCN